MSSKLLVGGVILVAAGLLLFGRFYAGNSSNSVSGGVSSAHNRASVGVIQAKNNLAPDFSLQKLGGADKVVGVATMELEKLLQILKVCRC